MDDKRADNTIIIKKKLAIVEDNISMNNKKLHDIEYTEELFNTLHKKLNRCAEILNRSMKSKKTTALVSDIEETNNIKVNFSKHKGRTLEEVYKEDKQYFMQLKNNEKTDEKLKRACEDMLADGNVSDVNKNNILNQQVKF